MTTSQPRHRENADLVPSSLKIDTQELPPPGAPTTFTGNGKNMGILEVMDDFVTPGFTRMKRDGHIVNNSMKRTRLEWVYPSRTWSFVKHPAANEPTDHQTWTRQIGGYIDGYHTLLFNVTLDGNVRELVNVSNFSRLAAIDARSRISPAFVQSIVSVAELHKTVELIGNTITTLRRFRRAIVNGDSYDILRRIVGRGFKRQKPSKGVGSSVASRWLEYRYGWLPLIYEVQGVVKALSPTREFKPRATVRGRRYATKDEEWDVVYNNLFTSVGHFTFHFKQVEELTCRAYCMFEADLQFQTARDFGVAEVPASMWELVPFSFIVDWFIPVGDWLTAITPKLGVNILAEGVTVKRNRVLSRTITNWASGGTSGSFWQNTGDAISTLPDKRIDLLSQRTPNLTSFLSFPPIDVKLNVKRVADALALLKVLR